MNTREFRRDIARLLRKLRADIGNEYRASEDDTVPGMQVTIGADRDGWSFQTGDNSYTGGAYGYRAWAVISLYRDSNCYELADDIINQLTDVSDAPIFGRTCADVEVQA